MSESPITSAATAAQQNAAAVNCHWIGCAPIQPTFSSNEECVCMCLVHCNLNITMNSSGDTSNLPRLSI